MKGKTFKLGYYLKLAFNGLIKNGVMTLSSVFVLLSCLVIMGSFALVFVNIEHNVQKIDYLNKIVIFAKKGTSEFELELMHDELNKIKDEKNLIKSIEFKSKEDALKEELAEYGVESDFLLETYKNDNPLKDSFIITYEDASTIETLMLYIEQLESYDSRSINLDVVNKLDNLKNTFAIIASWLMILLFVVSLFIIINTVKLSVYARRDEIALMRYIGATDLFISIPFLIEGLIIGFLAAGIGFGAQYVLYNYLTLELIGEKNNFIAIIPFSQLQYYLIAAFAVIGIATGFTGSLISLKKYNKENA